MNALRVAVVELPAAWDEREAMLARADDAIARAPADLVLLPELSLTGYVSPRLETDVARFAEPADGPTARALAALAEKHRVFLAGPLVERDGDRVHNACLVFAPDGSLVARYRKRHPWYVETWATPGAEPPPVFEVRGARVTLAICFDVQFAREDMGQELRAADVLLFPSAWVDEDDGRAVIFDQLTRAYDVAIANANWGRGVPRIAGQGSSRVVSRRGEVLAWANPGDLRADATLTPRGAASASSRS